MTWKARLANFHRAVVSSLKNPSEKNASPQNGVTQEKDSRGGKIIGKMFWNPWLQRRAILILATILILGLVAALLLAVYDYSFFEAFKSVKVVTAYFPWSLRNNIHST